MTADDVSLQPSRTLDRFRVAMRLTLWVWALYWAGGGILLLMGGLGLVGILVMAGSLACFVALLATGALQADASRNMKEFLLERPIYLVAGLVVLLVLAALVPPVENLGLALFSTLYLGSLGYAAHRLNQHMRATGQGPFRSGADQAFLVFGLVGFSTLLIFLDAWLPLLGHAPTPATPMSVLVSNWVNLLYPPLLMLATRPFREPLRRPRRRRGPAPENTPDAPALEA